VPEGDDLYRLAARLRPALVGKPVRELLLPRTEIGSAPRLVGRLVTSVEAKGKNLLVGFDDGSVLHTHLRMLGRWRLARDPEAPVRGMAWVVAVLRVPGATAVCYRAPVVRLLRPGAVAVDRRLAALGPDLLDPNVDLEEALRRLRARDAQPFGVALLDQQAVAGLGNVYKSELLFMQRLDPFAPVAACSDEELRALLALAVRVMVRNVGERPDRAPIEAGAAPRLGQRTRTTRAAGLGGGGPVHVYGRAGRPCLACGAAIRLGRQGPQRRSTYYCPACQPDRRKAASPRGALPAAPGSL
jgi:endonuclease-8